MRKINALITKVVLTQATIKALEEVYNVTVTEAVAKVNHGQMKER